MDDQEFDFENRIVSADYQERDDQENSLRPKRLED